MKKSLIATILALSICGSMAAAIEQPIEVQAKTTASATKSVKAVSFTVPTIYADTTVIKGKTTAYAWPHATIGKKVYKVQADKNGNYTLKIPKQACNTTISFYSWKSGYKTATTTRKVVKRYTTCLTADKVYTDTTVIKGKTKPDAVVMCKINNKYYKGTTDKNGNYTMTIPKQTAGTNKIYIFAKSNIYNIKTYMLSVYERPNTDQVKSVPFGGASLPTAYPEVKKYNSVTVSGDFIKYLDQSLEYACADMGKRGPEVMNFWKGKTVGNKYKVTSAYITGTDWLTMDYKGSTAAEVNYAKDSNAKVNSLHYDCYTCQYSEKKGKWYLCRLTVNFERI